MDLSDESDQGLADSFYDEMASPELRDEIFEEFRKRLDIHRGRLQQVEEERKELVIHLEAIVDAADKAEGERQAMAVIPVKLIDQINTLLAELESSDEEDE